MEEHLQRLLLAGVLGLTMARRAAAILDVGRPDAGEVDADHAIREQANAVTRADTDTETDTDTDMDTADGAVLRAILDAANECLGFFDDRPPSERWCDAMLHLLDLARFATDLG